MAYKNGISASSLFDVEYVGIDLKETCYLLARKWGLILLSTLIMACAGFAYSNYTYQPFYVADASMVVNAKQTKILGGEVVAVNNIGLSRQMVSTYRMILTSDSVMKLVNDELGTNYLPMMIKSWIRVSSPKDTEIIMVEVVNEDAALAASVANAIMKVAPQVVSETVEVGSINVLDSAKVPDELQMPEHGMKTAVGAIAGLIFGIFAVLAWELANMKIKGSKDISNKLYLDVLGEIPRGDFEKDEAPLIVSPRSGEPFTEAFRLLKYNMEYICRQSGMKKILVASAGEKEGKTTVSINMALSLADENKRVLLVECDMRRPSILKKLKHDGSEKGGLAEFLREEASWRKCLIKSRVRNLHILPAGAQDGGFERLLGSERMKAMIEEAAEEYDFIIMDTPPVNSVSDAALLSRYADGVAMVARQEQMTVKAVLGACESIENSGAEIIGCILNDIRFNGADHRYRYKYSCYNYVSVNHSTH